MQVTILGSGTVTPSLLRNASGIAIRTAGLELLVDMGPGTMRRMVEADIDTKLIDAILLTHFHPDHVSDLVPFLFASNYAFGPVREAPFYLIGPPGLEQFFRGLVAVYQDWIVPKGDRLVMKEMGASGRDGLSLGDAMIYSAPAPHTNASSHYRIEANGKSVTISGDTDMSEALIELAASTDLLICECSLPDDQKVKGHLTPSEAGEIARRADAKTLALTHFYPPCERIDVISHARRKFQGDIIRSEDLLTIEV